MRLTRLRRSARRRSISSATAGLRRRPATRCRWSTRRTASRSPPSPPATPRISTRRSRLPAEKGRLLAKLAREILDRAEELALTEARDCGKPLRQARADVAACARYFEFYGGASDKLMGDTIPYPTGYTVLTWREPDAAKAAE